MRRRAFINLLGGAATLPLTATAQQPVMPVIGFLSTLSPSNMAVNVMNEFHQGLKEAGFVEGQNMVDAIRQIGVSEVDYSVRKGPVGRRTGLPLWSLIKSHPKEKPKWHIRCTTRL